MRSDDLVELVEVVDCLGKSLWATVDESNRIARARAEWEERKSLPRWSTQLTSD